MDQLQLQARTEARDPRSEAIEAPRLLDVDVRREATGGGVKERLRTRALRGLPWALGLWAVGVQANEAVGTAGAWLTFALALLAAPARWGARQWWPLWAFLGCALLLPAFGGHAPGGSGALARMLEFALIPAAAIAVSLCTGRALVRVGLAACAVLLLSVTVAGAQHLGFWPGPEAFASLEWTRLGFHRVYETVPGRTDRFMAGGLLLHRLKFANVTAILCTLGIAAAALRVPRWRFFGLVSAVGLLGVALFPHARAALAAGILSAGLVWVLASSRRKQALLVVGLAGLLAVGLVLSTPSVRARFATSLTGEGSGERTSLNRAGVHAIAAHPLTGVGLGRFRPGDFLPPDAPAQAREHPGKAHNQLLTIGAEAGLPSVFLLLVALALWAAMGVRALPAGAPLLGAVTIVLLLSLLHDPLFHAESSLAVMLALGAGHGALQRRLRSTSGT